MLAAVDMAVPVPWVWIKANVSSMWMDEIEAHSWPASSLLIYFMDRIIVYLEILFDRVKLLGGCLDYRLEWKSKFGIENMRIKIDED